MNNLASEITRQLQRYANVVKEKVDEAGEEVSEQGVQKLKQTSPKRKVKGGTYSKGWRMKKVGTKWVTYNKIYQLTHLLEKGHAKVNGGRVDPIVHMKPVEEEMVEEFTRKVEEAARQ
ncbi:hypothetical protein [Lysinibacillus odysseyi]|uniref:hypothetical protein n=1 Tax=Lysinibacillus odysseyi TaxID=202611 RepID=UPI0007ABC8E0|nr:hypothetical protein [Lysinibacillus odysseyi]